MRVLCPKGTVSQYLCVFRFQQPVFATSVFASKKRFHNTRAWNPYYGQIYFGVFNDERPEKRYENCKTRLWGLMGIKNLTSADYSTKS